MSEDIGVDDEPVWVSDQSRGVEGVDFVLGFDSLRVTRLFGRAMMGILHVAGLEDGERL